VADQWKRDSPGCDTCCTAFLEPCDVQCANVPGTSWPNRVAISGGTIPADSYLIAPMGGTWTGVVVLPGFAGRDQALGCAAATIDLNVTFTFACPTAVGGKFTLTQQWRSCSGRVGYANAGTLTSVTAQPASAGTPYGEYDFSATDGPIQAVVTIAETTADPIIVRASVKGCNVLALEGASVGIMGAHGGYSSSGTTNSSGLADFTVPRSDRYFLTASAGRFQGGTATVDAGCYRTLNLTVRQCIAGVATAVSGATVEFDGLEHTTSGLGQVAVPFFEAKTYSIRAYKDTVGDRTAAATFNMAADVTAVLLLPDPIVVKVRVNGGVAGCAMPGATVRMFRTDLGYDETETTDAAGHAYFTTPLATTYTIQASIPGHTNTASLSASTIALCAETTFTPTILTALTDHMLLPGVGAREVPFDLDIAVAPGWNGGAAPAGTTVEAEYIGVSSGRYRWRYTGGGGDITVSIGPNNSCVPATYTVASTHTGATETAASGTAIPNLAFSTTNFTVSEQ
jgi:hypothetical protein